MMKEKNDVINIEKATESLSFAKNTQKHISENNEGVLVCKEGQKGYNKTLKTCKQNTNDIRSNQQHDTCSNDIRSESNYNIVDITTEINKLPSYTNHTNTIRTFNFFTPLLNKTSKNYESVSNSTCNTHNTPILTTNTQKTTTPTVPTPTLQTTTTKTTTTHNITPRNHLKHFSWIDRFFQTFPKVWLLLHTSCILLTTLVQSNTTAEYVNVTTRSIPSNPYNYTVDYYHYYYPARNHSYIINKSPSGKQVNYSRNQNYLDKFRNLYSRNNHRKVYHVSSEHLNNPKVTRKMYNYLYYKYRPERLAIQKDNIYYDIINKRDKERLRVDMREAKKHGKDLKNNANNNKNQTDKNNFEIIPLRKFLKKKLIRRHADNLKKFSPSSSFPSPHFFSASSHSSLSSSSSSSFTLRPSPLKAMMKKLPRRRRYNISRNNIYHKNNDNLNKSTGNRNNNYQNKTKTNEDDRFTRKERKDERLEHENYHLEPQKLLASSSSSSSSFSSSSELLNDQYACVYSGHVVTHKDWYGFLANLSMAGGVGRMEFEFSFPSEMCCLNVLFYHEDQLDVMNSSMNCWQKENLVNKASDKFLSLTPNFSWSGCHLKQQRGTSERIFYCRGGRSFVAGHSRQDTYDNHFSANKPSNVVNWFVAISNCDAMRGIDIHFRFRVYGHSLPCSQDQANDLFFNNLHPLVDIDKPPVVVPSLTSSLEPAPPPVEPPHGKWPICTIEGYVNTTNSWYGFLKNISLHDGGGFRYYFSLPFSMTPMSVYLYHKEDIHKLRWEQICWIKHGAIESSNVEERIINLSTSSVFNGCATKKGANIEGNNLTCKGEKIFRGDRDIYIAVGNCRGGNGVMLKYRLEVFGYKENTLCSMVPEIFRHSLFKTATFIFIYWSFF